MHSSTIFCLFNNKVSVWTYWGRAYWWLTKLFAHRGFGFPVCKHRPESILGNHTNAATIIIRLKCSLYMQRFFKMLDIRAAVVTYLTCSCCKVFPIAVRGLLMSVPVCVCVFVYRLCLCLLLCSMSRAAVYVSVWPL